MIYKNPNYIYGDEFELEKSVVEAYIRGDVLKEIKSNHNISNTRLYAILDSHGIEPNRVGRRLIGDNLARARNFHNLRLEGYTLQAIGEMQDPPISRQRVDQIVKSYRHQLGLMPKPSRRRY